MEDEIYKSADDKSARAVRGAAKIEREKYIRNLCEEFIKAKNADDKSTKKIYMSLIHDYCKSYYNVFKTQRVERGEVFNSVMTSLFDKGIEAFVKKERSCTFESFFLTKTKEHAYALTNGMDVLSGKTGYKSVVYRYSKIKEVSEMYGIPISVGNAYKFVRLLEDNSSCNNLSRVISAIDGYMTVESTSNMVTGQYE